MWGIDQAERHLDHIEACCKAIGDGKTRSKSHDVLPKDVRVHRFEHPYIFWLAGDQPIVIAVLRDRTDLVSRPEDRL